MPSRAATRRGDRHPEQVPPASPKLRVAPFSNGIKTLSTRARSRPVRPTSRRAQRTSARTPARSSNHAQRETARGGGPRQPWRWTWGHRRGKSPGRRTSRRRTEVQAVSAAESGPSRPSRTSARTGRSVDARGHCRNRVPPVRQPAGRSQSVPGCRRRRGRGCGARDRPRRAMARLPGPLLRAGVWTHAFAMKQAAVGGQDDQALSNRAAGCPGRARTRSSNASPGLQPGLQLDGPRSSGARSATLTRLVRRYGYTRFDSTSSPSPRRRSETLDLPTGSGYLCLRMNSRDVD